MKSLPKPVAISGQFIWYLGRQFYGDKCPTSAASLTYQSLFAVVPLLTVMYAMFNAIDAFSGVGSQVQAFLFENIIPENVSVVQSYLTSFSDQASALSGPSFLLLTVTAFLMLYTIEQIFNDIWDVREPRHGFQRFLMYWALLTLGPILLGLGFAITTYVLSIPVISGVTEVTGALRILPVLISVVLFTLIYVAVPNCRVPIPHAFVGGVLVAVVFELAKVMFAEIMSRSSFEVIYGAFAAVPLFLLWIYILWSILLMGAEFVKAISGFRVDNEGKAELPFVQVLLILDCFYRVHRRGGIVREADIRSLSPRVEYDRWHEYQALLADMNIIEVIDKDSMMLRQDLNEISVWQLFHQVPYQLPNEMHGSTAWELRLGEQFKGITGRNKESLGMDLESLFRSGD
jgi:membrane protein